MSELLKFAARLDDNLKSLAEEAKQRGDYPPSEIFKSAAAAVRSAYYGMVAATLPSDDRGGGAPVVADDTELEHAAEMCRSAYERGRRDGGAAEREACAVLAENMPIGTPKREIAQMIRLGARPPGQRAEREG